MSLLIPVLISLAVQADRPSPHADRTGMGLLRSCEDAEDKRPITVDSASCASYIIGAVDASLLYAERYRSNSSSRVFCAPPEATYAQYVRIVIKFLRDHPERLHETRERLIQDALHAAFPCRK